MSKTQIGTVVIYKTTKEDREKLKAKKACNESKELPAIIVSVYGDTANLKVLLDGTGELWKTSIEQGHDEGYWNIII